MLPQLFVLFAAIGGTALILGGGALLWYRVKRLEEASRAEPAGRRPPVTELEDVKEELNEAREETRRLAERLDFVERLLETRSETDENDHQLARGGS